MLKAVFVDYTGTLMEEDGPDVREMVARCCKNSEIGGPKAMMEYWWGMVKAFEERYSGKNYRTEDEIVDEILAVCTEQIHLRENLDELHGLVHRFWMYSPAFPDAKEFFARCPLPVYVITNNSRVYVEEGLRDKGLRPAGIVCGDMARAYKPHRELFEKALAVSGCQAEEVVHIGDSVASDVMGATSAGIRPLLLDRRGKGAPEGVEAVRTLNEALGWIEREMGEAHIL